jgi:hypothetical protein
MVVRSGLTPTSRRGRRASPGNRPRSGSRPWWSVRQRFLTSTKSPIEAPISCPRLGREVRAAAGTASQPPPVRVGHRLPAPQAVTGLPGLPLPRRVNLAALKGPATCPPTKIGTDANDRQGLASRRHRARGDATSSRELDDRRDRHRAVANRAASSSQAAVSFLGRKSCPGAPSVRPWRFNAWVTVRPEKHPCFVGILGGVMQPRCGPPIPARAPRRQIPCSSTR